MAGVGTAGGADHRRGRAPVAVAYLVPEQAADDTTNGHARRDLRPRNPIDVARALDLVHRFDGAAVAAIGLRHDGGAVSLRMSGERRDERDDRRGKRTRGGQAMKKRCKERHGAAFC